jgi:hypothetical protein
MIVLRITVIVLKDASTVEIHLAKQTGFDKFRQGPIDGGPAHFTAPDFLCQIGHELIGIKMGVLLEYLFQDQAPLSSVSHAAALQVLFKPLIGCLRNLNVAQGKVFDHLAEPVWGAVPQKESRAPCDRCGFCGTQLATRRPCSLRF